MTTLECGVYTSVELTGSPDFQLNMSFMPKDLMAHWKRCGMTADFLASSQWANWHPQVCNVVSTVLNELIENAVKYSAVDSKPIKLQFRVIGDLVDFEISNWAKEQIADGLGDQFRQLLSQDRDEMYLLHLEDAAKDGGDWSQMGLVSIVHDYEADLGCRILRTADTDAPCQVTIRVIINTQKVAQHVH
ncbi:hypothetical protein EBR96_02940 [bacterium]|nr:hypothetical protein [bacterium]